ASAFKDWAEQLPQDTELCIVQMPGREERLGEPLIDNMARMAESIALSLGDYTDRPYAFFGHSMGAMVAYEVARLLRKHSAALPAHLFLSARAAPHLQDHSEPLRHLDSEQFINRVHELYGAVPDAIRQSVELQQVFLPILRADVALLETHIYAEEKPLQCPITVIGGDSDPAITANMLAGWQQLTSAAFAQTEFAGGHFYLHSQRDALVAFITEQLNG
ncbi:MAG: alpha/beta fold hydrolase, partial [Pseudomonadota bacterium]